MTLKRFTWKDWVVSVFALLGCLALFYPWQIVFIETSSHKIYRILVELIPVLVLIYIYFRIAHLPTKRKWFIRVPIILLGVFCTPSIAQQFLYRPHNQSTYAVFYTKPDRSENIAVYHYHGFLSDWNETKHVIIYRKLGIEFQKNFELEDLNGEWYVHPDNPYHPVEGIARFKHGELMR